MLKEKLYRVIFRSDTTAGKAFDIVLLILIFISIMLVMLDSVPHLHEHYQQEFHQLEWAITILFTIEYLLRIYSVSDKWRYITSFYGVVDLLSILPTYLGAVVGSTKYLSIIRVLRLLRIFRIFDLQDYTASGQAIFSALKESRKKITVFLVFIIIIVIAFGGIMYVVESGHPKSAFDSIPKSIYWAIVTITTVGYGDIYPVTATGKFIASIIMIIGYAVLAVPTGIVTAEFTRQKPGKQADEKECKSCGRKRHEPDAKFCRHCGNPLP